MEVILKLKVEDLHHLLTEVLVDQILARSCYVEMVLIVSG